MFISHDSASDTLTALVERFAANLAFPSSQGRSDPLDAVAFHDGSPYPQELSARIVLDGQAARANRVRRLRASAPFSNHGDVAAAVDANGKCFIIRTVFGPIPRRPEGFALSG